MSRFQLILSIFCILSLTAFGTGHTGHEEPIKKQPKFISFNIMNGPVLQTNDFVSGNNNISNYTSASFRYGVSSSTNTIQDYIYGLPYWGIGVYAANFHRKNDLGTPLSIYVFQGARIAQIRPRLWLNYEWNLGYSFNWKHYDEFDNPNNVAIGSATNVHISGNIYFKWEFSKKVDFNFGLSATHFSNGASAKPNGGLNMVAAYVGVVYNFNRESFAERQYTGTDIYSFTKRVDHDFTFTFTSRRIEIDTAGTGLNSPFPSKDFRVLGLSYSHMFVKSLRWKWGPSIEFTYDESSGIKSWAERHPDNGKIYDRIKLGALHDRFSVGVSMKGEISMPLYSMFANIGYDFIHAKNNDSRLYQILGIKIPVTQNIYGTFGIRATRFSRAQYLYWSIGYSLKRDKKKDL